MQSAIKLSAGDQFYRPTVNFIDRLKAFYRRESALFGGAGRSMWSIIDANFRSDIHTALLANDQSAQELLSDPIQTKLFFGVDNLYNRTPPSPEEEQAWKDRDLELLRQVGHLTGISRVPNPEGGEKFMRGTTPEPLSGDAILQAIDDRLGCRLAFVNPFRGEIGLETSRGIVSLRSPHALYQAWRTTTVLDLVNGQSVLEIGGGMGRTAYLSKQLGIKRYAIVDLPSAQSARRFFFPARSALTPCGCSESPIARQVKLHSYRHARWRTRNSTLF